MTQYTDWLAFYVFQAGYSFDETATILTGAQMGTAEHIQAEKDVTDAIRRYVRARDKKTHDNTQDQGVQK